MGDVNAPLDASPLVGRDRERERLRAFVGGAGASSCLVVTGEPGIGKTSLWEDGLDTARQVGCLVVATRASEAEAQLSFAALGDLVAGIGPGALSGLPEPQLHALEVALRTVDPGGVPPDPLAISIGFLGALRTIASEGRVLIAIDDVQWLDESSAGPILFALRRLSGEGPRILVSRLAGSPSIIEKELRPAGVDELELGGLSLGAVNHLLSDKLGLRLPRRELRQLYDASHGNPLFAIELGRQLVGAGPRELGADLPLPRLVEGIFGERVRELAEPVRRVLLAAALSAALTIAELSALADPLALEDAISSDLLVVDGTRVRVAHPLLAAAVRQNSSGVERRELHLGLASVVTADTLRARHLAMASIGPDAEIAAIAAAAGDLAFERGAVHEAEELAAHALRLTPRGASERVDRLLTLARRHLDAGDMVRAREVLSTQVSDLPDRRSRAMARLLLAYAVDIVLEERELEMALVEAGDDPEILVMVLERKALMLAVSRVERIDEAEAVADEALALARSVGPELESRLIPVVAWTRTLRGRPLDDLGLGETPTGSVLVPFVGPTERAAGVRLAFRGEIDRARSIFRSLEEKGYQSGVLRLVFQMHVQLCELAIRAGDVNEARCVLEELRVWTSSDDVRNLVTRLEALIEAEAGDPLKAVDLAAMVLGAESPQVSGWNILEALRARGLAALFQQEPERAVEDLWPIWERCVREHVDDPGAFPVAPDLVEALVQVGDLQRAGEVTNRLGELAAEQDHPWGLATVGRCSALIALADGYEDEPAGELRESAVDYGRLGLDFDCARSLLALGRAERRGRKYRDARRSLEEAAALFDLRGSHGWAELARSELSRVSGRRQVAEEGLTPSEYQVATLAATGMSNKEIAGQLFVSVSTVEAHLSHAYAKLGVRSRAGLAQSLEQQSLEQQ